MRTRVVRHMLAAVGAPLLVIAINLFALGGVASAHVVSSINADCYLVTVHFSDFPEAGVMVHVAVDVNGTTLGSDVLVKSASSETNVDISPVTAVLVAGPAHIDVDVTWTFLGSQHVHESLTLTCGTTTTTSSSTTGPTITTAALAPTTTAVLPPATTTGSTSTTSAASTTSTEVKAATTVASTTTLHAPRTSSTVRVQGVTATTPTPPGPSTLPRTGSSTGFPLLFGLSALLAGALLVVRHGRAWSR